MIHKDIDYWLVMDYLKNTGVVSYSNPDDATDEEEKKRLLSVKENAQKATAELKKMAELCAEKFELDKCERIKWLDGSNEKTRNYLWAQLKYSDYSNNRESISIFVEMPENEEHARFRFSLEFNEEKKDKEKKDKEKKDKEKKAALENYHRHLDLPISDDSSLIYVASNKESSNLEFLGKDVEEIKSKIADGTYDKVQICSIVDYNDEITNDEIEAEMLRSVSELLPYYDHVLLGRTSKEALESMDLSSIDIEKTNVETSEFDKNMILYGPPGTGKTYNTVNYAVAICEGLSLEEVISRPYDEVFDKYNKLKKTGRIAFTTFHQSYGYEEFIEGIKPVMDSGEETSSISYTIKDGVFKDFCDKASKVTVDMKTTISNTTFQISEDAKLWCMILGGNEAPDLANKCFEEGTVRIGWSVATKRITEEEQTLNDKERRMLLNFQDEMEVGDIVVTRTSDKEINSIGIVTGDYEYDSSSEMYPRKRNVDWIYKGDPIDISDLNGQRKLERYTIYPLNHVSIDELLKRIPGGPIIEENRPYVFIIDEINRGNISKIFGELITLIETTKRRGGDEAAEVILPYSNTPFSVPGNVYIIGTMNTADRSIALMDTALRRRFQFVEMMPDSDVLRTISADKIQVDGEDLDVAHMLDVINQRIEYLYDREHTIGHAFFTGLVFEPTIDKLADIFRKSVIPLLQEYFYEDYGKIMMILGDNGKNNDEHKFIIAKEIKPNSIFRGDTSDVDIPDYSYEIQESAFKNINSYLEIIG